MTEWSMTDESGTWRPLPEDAFFDTRQGAFILDGVPVVATLAESDCPTTYMYLEG